MLAGLTASTVEANTTDLGLLHFSWWTNTLLNLY